VFGTSGFRDAAVLVIDGSGAELHSRPAAERAVVLNPDTTPDDWEWLSYYEAEGITLQPVFRQVTRPHSANNGTFGSLGDIYGEVGEHLFKSSLDGPGKVMGLAPYGSPTIPVDRWLSVDETGLVKFRPDGHKQSRQCRWPNDFIACANAAASVQQALEHALMAVAARLRALSPSANLCYAGGVALNSVANERLVRDGGFEQVLSAPPPKTAEWPLGARITAPSCSPAETATSVCATMPWAVATPKPR
jgi:carbamoyltransferase